MGKSHKVGVNDPCPCGQLAKYKNCCRGKIDWEEIFRSGRDWKPYLSNRGRNIHFVNRMFEALQLDKAPATLKGYKEAFTADAVRRIHEALVEVWPPDLDIHEALSRHSGDVSGLYVGDYGPEYLGRGVVRHSIYANKILLVDPFIYPRSVRDEFNPILSPAQHRAQALKNANLWHTLLPWIEAGLVEMIRTPADFDRQLNWDSMKRAEAKVSGNEKLQKAIKETVEQQVKRHRDKMALETLVLGSPDFHLENLIKKLKLEKDGYTAKDFIAYVQQQRDSNPNFLEPIGPDSPTGQLHIMTSGANYEIARLTAGITGSYLVTDLYSRWCEIEMDRESHSGEMQVWSPFAKALQEAPLKFLNSLRLDHALRLRRDGRLESLRNFFLRVWRQAATDDPFSEANSRLLAEELQGEVAKAEQEWKKIDQDLFKFVGTEIGTGFLAAGPLIAAGHGDFVAAAAVAAGAFNIASTTMQRRAFPSKFPAAFFMKIEGT